MHAILASSAFSSPEWRQLFALDTPLLEIFVRGSVIYLGIFILLRIVLKREAGTLGMTDLLVVVLIADAAQNGMTGDYKSITDGLLLVGTILFWSWALNLLAYKNKMIARLIHPPAITLIRDGKVNRRNLRHELITNEELLSILRQHGVESPEEVAQAKMEGDGQVSVIMAKKGKTDEAPQKKKLS
ncbi:MAG: DUF421 domain-containing protein [Gemmatimonadaceae bacterium]|nr:DUF421 domain-containing protein [Gemmatimonadaceae bacterium]